MFGKVLAHVISGLTFCVIAVLITTNQANALSASDCKAQLDSNTSKCGNPDKNAKQRQECMGYAAQVNDGCNEQLRQLNAKP